MKWKLFKKPIDPALAAQLACLFFIVLSVLSPDFAIAGTTGNELSGAWTKVSDIIGGFGGKLIAGVSFLCALVGSVWGFNPRLVIGAGGVGITTALAPTFINATVGALI